MTTENKQMTTDPRGRFSMISTLLTCLVALTAYEKMTPAVFAAPPAAVSAIDHPTHTGATMATGNASRNASFQQTAAAIGKVSGAKVSIANFAFAPTEITIAPGESVTWTNDDGAPHGLEFDDNAPGTNLLLPGASFSRQFDRPGTYDYNCSVHPYMTGRVIVRA
jgi:plastocyanin